MTSPDQNSRTDSLTRHRYEDHPKLRVRTMQELFVLESQFMGDCLEWPLYTADILAGYKDLPRY